MEAVHGDGCIDVKNVRKWVRHAKSCRAGEMSVLDEHRSGRPISVTRDENQCRVDATIQENRRIKQRDIALKLGISQERVHHITATLKYRKVCPWWVPRQLADLMRNTGKMLLKNFLAYIVLKGMIPSRILPLPHVLRSSKCSLVIQGAPEVPCMHFYSPHTCPVPFVLSLDFITQITCAKQYTSQSSSICSFLLSSVTAFVLGPKRFLSSPYLNTLGLRSSPM